MSRIKQADLEKLVHGKALPRDEFLALLGSAEAAAMLEKAACLADLVGPVEEEPESALPDMPVTWEEIGLYAQDRLTDEARRAAVERFLSEHGPKPLRQPPGLEDTLCGEGPLDQTRIDLPPASPRHPSKNPDSAQPSL